MRKLLGALLLLCASALPAAVRYADPAGSGASCTVIGTPCKLEVALTQLVAGDTLYLRGGVYTKAYDGSGYMYSETASGDAVNRITITNYPGETAIIRGTVRFTASGTMFNVVGSYVTIKGLVLDMQPTDTVGPPAHGSRTSYTQGSWPTDIGLVDAFGALPQSGPAIKDQWFINNVVHDVRQGWSTYYRMTNTIYYGNIVWNVGWDEAPDPLCGTGGVHPACFTSSRGHGFGLYLQNQCTYSGIPAGSQTAVASTLHAEENVDVMGFTGLIKFYGSGDAAEEQCVVLKGNITADGGYLSTYGLQDSFLFGGGGANNHYDVEENISYTCCSYNSGPGGMVWLNNNGIGTFLDITMKNNYWKSATRFGGGPGNISCSGCVITGNDFVGSANYLSSATYPSNTFWGSNPTTNKVIVRPNAYEPGRCNIVIFNYQSLADQSVNVDTCGLTNGATYEVRDAYAFLGTDNANDATKTVISGTYTTGVPISFPLNHGRIAPVVPYGYATKLGTETWKPMPSRWPFFSVFVLLPQTAAPTPTPTNTPTNTPTPTPITPTATLTPTATFTPTPTPAAPTSTPTRTFTPSPTQTPNPAASIQSVELESCVLTAPMAAVADATASGGYHIATTVSGSVTPANGGTAVCTFVVPADGYYRGWMRVSSADGNTDSFYIRWDSETAPTGSPATHVFDFAEQITCPPANQPAPSSWGLGWVYNIINDRSNNCNGSTTEPGYERTTNPGDVTVGQFLTAGTHTFTLYGREVGAKADRMIITTNLAYDPRVSPATPTPVPGAGVCKRWWVCNGRAYQACFKRVCH